MENATKQESKWDFEVSKIPLSEVEDLKDIAGLNNDTLLVNKSTNARLGIVSKDYDVLTHRQAVDLTTDVIREIAKGDNRFEKFHINELHTLVKQNGTQAKIEIEFPGINYEIGKTKNNVGDLINLTFTISNGIGSRTPFTISLGASRLVCSNGLTTNERIKGLRFIHKNMDLEKLKDAVLEKFKGFSNVIEEWRNLANKPLTVDQVKNFFEKTKQEAPENGVSKKHIERIETLATDLLEQEGSNAFVLFNSATNYTTHDLKLTSMKNAIYWQGKINSYFYEAVKMAV